MTIVSAPGAELYYTSHGEGPVCLVPSAIGTKPYALQLRALAKRFNVVIVSLRGSGESSGDPGGLTFDVAAADFERVREDLDADRVVVLGHSILGVLALEYGKRYPDHVSHAVMVGTPPCGDLSWLMPEQMKFFADDASEERKSLVPADMAALPPEQALLAQTPLRFFDPRFDAAPYYADAQMRMDFFQHLIGPLMSPWTAAEAARELRVPLLIAHGRYDYTVPYRLWEPVLPGLRTATFRLFERSGHQPFLEEGELFTRVLEEWMGHG